MCQLGTVKRQIMAGKFVKLYRIEGTEVVFRRAFELTDGKPKFTIDVNAYFDNYATLGFLPEVQMKLPVCCFRCQEREFQKIDGDFAKGLFEKLKAIINERKQAFTNISIHHN
jgi:hypothetical protein